MSSDIRAWLNGSRSFAAGAQLYKQHGTNADLKNRLLQGETTTLKKELFFALKDLLQADVSNGYKPDVSVIPKTVTPPAAGQPAAEENQASLEAKKEADLLYQEMQNTRAQLLGFCTVEESPVDRDPEVKKLRGRLARQIMQLQQLVDDAYDDYRYALQHGQRRHKEAPVASEIDPLVLPQTILNLRKSISKWLKKPQTLQVEQTIAQKQELLTQYIAQYEQAKAR